MTPQQRWRANDGLLRTRINEGDAFAYIGRDPNRNPSASSGFDLTGSELLRLQDRNIQVNRVDRVNIYEVLGNPAEVQQYRP
jgi:hypothetical protein